MGAGICPIFEPPIPILFTSDGKLLFGELEQLDQLATLAGEKPFSSFGDNRDLPEDFEGDWDELDDALGPFEERFDPSDVIRTVEAIIAKLRQELSQDDPFSEHHEIIAELSLLLNCLLCAKESGSVFYFEVF